MDRTDEVSSKHIEVVDRTDEVIKALLEVVDRTDEVSNRTTVTTLTWFEEIFEE
ncbi:hypothetical protein [Streptococcus pneumoniae]|uniref:hypothetical protein n=1 Tax=Streptococcus pneumoniae TaxID=1313 RepID=UPI0015DAA5DA|nr:hypothetical protein [Streptococcus pneumoniae]